VASLLDDLDDVGAVEPPPSRWCAATPASQRLADFNPSWNSHMPCASALTLRMAARRR